MRRDQNVIRPTEASGFISRRRCHPFAIHMAITMTSAAPATTEDRKKLMGMTADHHCDASVSGIRRYREPSELWCIVDNVTAAMASRIGSKTVLGRPRNNHASVPKISAVPAV